MTGPVDTVVLEKHNWKWRQWPSWVSGIIYTNNESHTRMTHALRHPAVIRNEVRKDGTRPMSPWSKDWFRGVTALSTWKIRNIPGKDAWCYDFNDSPVITRLPQQEATNLYWDSVVGLFPFKPTLAIHSESIARTKLLNKVAQKQWDLGVTALELKQTAGLVTDLAQGLTSTVVNMINSRQSMREKLNLFFRDVRRQGDFTLAARNVGLKDTALLEDIRARWMQYQFGIRPLVYDMHDAANYLGGLLDAENLKVLVKAKAGHTTSDEYLAPGTFGTIISSMEARLQFRETCSTHFSVVYEMPTDQVPAVTSLGLDNPYAIAWEVTRLSWMVDYVVNIGDWLQSFTAANGLVFREGCRSVLKRRVTTGVHLKAIKPPFGVSAQYDKLPSNEGTYIERGRFERTLLSPPGVTPAIMPQIKSKVGLVKLANSLFAMSSVLGGSRGLR